MRLHLVCIAPWGRFKPKNGTFDVWLSLQRLSVPAVIIENSLWIKECLGSLHSCSCWKYPTNEHFPTRKLHLHAYCHIYACPEITRVSPFPRSTEWHESPWVMEGLHLWSNLQLEANFGPPCCFQIKPYWHLQPPIAPEKVIIFSKAHLRW